MDTNDILIRLAVTIGTVFFILGFTHTTVMFPKNDKDRKYKRACEWGLLVTAGSLILIFLTAIWIN